MKAPERSERDAEPGDAHLANYAVQTQVQVLKYTLCGCASFGLRVRGYSDAGYDAVVLFKSPTVVSITLPYLTQWKDLTMNPIGTHTYRIEVQGSSIRFLIDGNLQLQATNSNWKDGGYIYLTASNAQLVVQRYAVFAL